MLKLQSNAPTAPLASQVETVPGYRDAGLCQNTSKGRVGCITIEVIMLVLTDYAEFLIQRMLRHW